MRSTKRALDEQLTYLRNAGFVPIALTLSRARYTQFLEDLAYREGRDEIEPISHYEGLPVVIVFDGDVCEVAVDAQQHWLNADGIEEILRPTERVREPRFAEI